MEARTHEGRTIHALIEEEYRDVVCHVEDEYEADSYGRVHPVRYTVRALLATAMRSAELAHLSRDWLVTHDGDPTVEVQDRDCGDPCCAYCEKQAERNVRRREPDLADRADSGDAAAERELEALVEAEKRGQWQPKSSNGRRKITVYDDEAWALMNRYLEEHGDGVVNPNTVWQRVKKVDAAFDFEKPLTPHRLRHSAATRMHRAGVGVEDISGELGHASMETTMIYIQEPYSSRANRIRDRMS